MEGYLAEELRIEKKLKELENRKKLMWNKHKKVNLADIKTPEDIGTIAESKCQAALARNASFLLDLEIESGKLHTTRLCPIDSKLEELKRKFVQDS